MGSRSLLGVLTVAASVVLWSCGAGSDQPRGLGQAAKMSERAGVDGGDVVDALCQHWRMGYSDSPTVNSYIHDLLLPLDLVNSEDPPAYGQADIDAAVTAACKNELGDPEAFVDAVAADIGLTAADIEARVRAACDRYRRQQRRIARGDWSGEDLAPLIRSIAASVGLDEAGLRQAIDGVCRPSAR